MPTIDEKRVYGDRAGKTELYVATSVGVVAVSVSGGRIGGFGVDHRCVARDVATAEGEGERGLAVATDEDVLLRGRTDEGETGAGDGGVNEAYEPTGFGPAVAVGADGDGWLAADEDGGVARYDAAAGEWTTLGRAGEGGGGEEVRAIHGPLVAASDGVYRVADGLLAYTGLDDARDVAGGVPLAATAEGLYSLGNGWMDELDGSFRAVVADGARAHAAAVEAIYARNPDGGGEGGDGSGGGGEWTAVELPTDELVVDFAYGGGATFALTEAGTLFVNADGLRADADGDESAGGADGRGSGGAGAGEWRPQTLGLDGAVSVTAE